MENQDGSARIVLKKKMTEEKIIEVKRICGDCWEEDRKIIPLYELEEEENMKIEVHNHRIFKIKEKILEALK